MTVGRVPAQLEREAQAGAETPRSRPWFCTGWVGEGPDGALKLQDCFSERLPGSRPPRGTVRHPPPMRVCISASLPLGWAVPGGPAPVGPLYLCCRGPAPPPPALTASHLDRAQALWSPPKSALIRRRDPYCPHTGTSRPSVLALKEHMPAQPHGPRWLGPACGCRSGNGSEQ